MARILCVSVIRSDFGKLFRLASWLRENNHDVEFFFDQRAHDLTLSVQEAKSAGFSFIAFPEKIAIRTRTAATATRASSGFAPVTFLRRWISECNALRRLSNVFRKTLSDKQVTHTIFPANSYGYNLPIYAHVCSKARVTSLCVPFAIGEKDALAKALSNSRKNGTDYLLNGFFMPFFKEWVIRSGDRKYLVLPAETILAYKVFGIKVKYPSSFYGVQVDALLLESDYMKTHAESQGIAANKVVVTGSIFDDELVEMVKHRREKYEAICIARGWNPAWKLMCIALPPFVKDKMGGDERFFEIQQLVSLFLPSSVDRVGWNVAISLHPRIDQKNAGLSFVGDNITVTSDPVEKWIPLTDLFITTFSSTIRTAVALGVPVINYDILQFRYSLFSDLNGIKHVTTQDEYCSVLEAELARIVSKTEAKDGGLNPFSSVMDGKSGKRILTMFEANA